MRLIDRVYFDESGHTGSNIADLSQPVFSMASTLLPREEADRLLSPFSALNQTELKYSKTRKTTKGQRLIESFLHDSVITGATSKIYVIHKPFMIASKLVDMIHEPLAHENGINFHSNKAALALANLITTTYPVFAGNTRYYRLLELFVKAVRSKEANAIARFFREAKDFKSLLDNRLEQGGLELVPVLEEERRGAPNILGASADALDPIVPAFNMHVAHWSRESNKRFVVVSDHSSILERNQQVFLDFSNPSGEPMSANYYGETIKYPLKIQQFEFADSRAEASLRVVDLLAGIAADAANPRANQEAASDYQRRLITTLFEKNLILGALWPSRDVTPESLDAVEETAVNPADIAAKFLSSVRRANNLRLP